MTVPADLMPVVYNMDCREGLAALPDGSVHCVVTSPPYWGLRDYGLGSDQLGLERTPEEYVERLVGIFREVRRVLRDDGVMFLNLGDSYAVNRRGGGSDFRGLRGLRGPNDKPGSNCSGTAPDVNVPPGLKPKDLVGIPWRVAFALQADGWHLRADIIWAKPNPLPESVTDRPTKSHEYVFLLSKSARYFYDQEAAREPSGWSHRGKYPLPNPAGRNKRSVWIIPTEPFSGARLLADYVGDDGKPYKASPDCPLHGHLAYHSKTAKCTCQPVTVDHFATFPRKLVEPCILAGCPERVCPVCGKPWVRVVEKGEPDREWQARCGADASGGYAGMGQKDYSAARAQNPSDVKARILAGMKKRITLGFRPACSCAPDSWLPGVVLDPFLGSGTTCVVAYGLGRRSIGFEASSDYTAIANRRIAKATSQVKFDEVLLPDPVPREGGLGLWDEAAEGAGEQLEGRVEVTSSLVKSYIAKEASGDA